MTAVVVDASALAAVVFQEPDGETVSRRLDGATVFAPHLLKFELTNTAWKKARRQPAAMASIFTALAIALDAQTGLSDIGARKPDEPTRRGSTPIDGRPLPEGVRVSLIET